MTAPLGEAYEATSEDTKRGVDRRLGVALGFGILGMSTSLVSDRFGGLWFVTAICWVASVGVFASTWAPFAPVLRAGLASGAAAAVSVFAARTWFLAPVAFALWVLSARLAGLHWRWLLAAGSAVVGSAALALVLGATGVADALLLLSYAFGTVACGLALLPGSGR